jgi:hypothetical protein
MNLYERGLDIINEFRVLPLQVTLLSKDFQKNIIVYKKFHLNTKSKNIMNKIKDIKIIIMDDKFNAKIKFPKGIKEIIFGKKFNKEVILPKGLQNLTMGDDFNQIIKLPKSLIKLTTGQKFNQMIKLRSNLETLNLGKEFNQLITLPENLKYMSMPQDCEQPIIMIKNLKELFYYIKKTIVLPIFNKEIKERLIDLQEITPNKTKIFAINFNLATSNKIKKIAIINEFET